VQKNGTESHAELPTSDQTSKIDVHVSAKPTWHRRDSLAVAAGCTRTPYLPPLLTDGYRPLEGTTQAEIRSSHVLDCDAPLPDRAGTFSRQAVGGRCHEQLLQALRLTATLNQDNDMPC